jgi:hypothetical protein
MVLLVEPEQIPQLVIGTTLGSGGRRCHDQDSTNELVAIPIIPVGVGIELRGRHPHARGGRADPLSNANPGSAHG